jgi:hypothetical protein
LCEYRCLVAWASGLSLCLPSPSNFHFEILYITIYLAQFPMSPGQAEGIMRQLGIHHQARAWLERAVNEACGRRAVVLWRLYMALERSLGRHTALKGVYYRAVQSCPWAKVTRPSCFVCFFANKCL